MSGFSQLIDKIILSRPLLLVWNWSFLCNEYFPTLIILGGSKGSLFVSSWSLFQLWVDSETKAWKLDSKEAILLLYVILIKTISIFGVLFLFSDGDHGRANLLIHFLFPRYIRSEVWNTEDKVGNENHAKCVFRVDHGPFYTRKKLSGGITKMYTTTLLQVVTARCLNSCTVTNLFPTLSAETDHGWISSLSTVDKPLSLKHFGP